MAVTADAVTTAAEDLGFSLISEQADGLTAYLDQLEKWNRKMNLVGPRKWRAMFDTLVVDSLHLADFMKEISLPAEPLTLDFGAGAGLPGIPLRILWQAGAYRLIEVRQKRVTFMRSVLGRIKPGDTEAIECRAEDSLQTLHNKCANLILSRAFMPWLKLLELVGPMLCEGGQLIILSNDPAPEELPDGWRLAAEKSYPVAGTTRHFWALQPEASN